jgi:3-oxoacyl-[acyl-carrier protein] reductase
MDLGLAGKRRSSPAAARASAGRSTSLIATRWSAVEASAKELDLNLWGCMAASKEVVNAAILPASPASSFTTGSNLVVDGALTRRVQY